MVDFHIVWVEDRVVAVFNEDEGREAQEFARKLPSYLEVHHALIPVNVFAAIMTFPPSSLCRLPAMAETSKPWFDNEFVKKYIYKNESCESNCGCKESLNGMEQEANDLEQVVASASKTMKTLLDHAKNFGSKIHEHLSVHAESVRSHLNKIVEETRSVVHEKTKPAEKKCCKHKD